MPALIAFPAFRLVAMALLASIPATIITAAPADVAIVVRADTPVDNLTFSEARKLFMGDRQYWSSGLRVTLLIRAPVARERNVILKVIYGMSEAQFRQYWISKVFRLEASTGPKIVYSNTMEADLVSAVPGAVAFMDAALVPKGLKVLKIDGLLPGEKGYSLH